jgi:peroxiredoxin
MTRKRSLSDELEAIRDASSERARMSYDTLVRHLIDSGATHQALREGDDFPDFRLPNAEGRLVTREELLRNGPAVVSFYRGIWCPYCSAELNALAGIAPQIAARGGSLAAITPEVGGAALKTKVERALAFEVLCDMDNTLALECGLLFPLPDDIRAIYLERGIDFNRIYGNDAWLLPVPATYVVRSDSVIATAYVNPDFRYRLDPTEILKALD